MRKHNTNFTSHSVFCADLSVGYCYQGEQHRMASLRCVGSPGGCTRPVQVVRHQRLNKLQPCRAPKLATWVARCSNQVGGLQGVS